MTEPVHCRVCGRAISEYALRFRHKLDAPMVVCSLDCANGYEPLQPSENGATQWILIPAPKDGRQEVA